MSILRQFSKTQTLFLLLVIFVCSLLFYANGVAFKLFPAPTYSIDVIAYSALAVAITLTIVMVAIGFRDMRNGVFRKKQNPDILNQIAESEETPDMPPVPINSTENITKTSPDPEVLQVPNTQKSQVFKQLAPQRIKLICPACRKEFRLPPFMGDLIVDFGPTKSSNIIKNCPYCNATIPLKKTNAALQTY